MGNTQRGFRGSNTPTPRKPFRPMIDQQIPIKRIRKLFSLFIDSVQHEVSNSMSSLQSFVMSNFPIKYSDTDNLFISLNKLYLLRSLADGTLKDSDLNSLNRNFTGSELFQLTIRKSGNYHKSENFVELKRLTNIVLSEMYTLLNELSSFFELHLPHMDPNAAFKISRLFKFGIILVNAIDALMQGTLDIDAETVPKKILGKEISSLEHDIYTIFTQGNKLEVNVESRDISENDKALSFPIFTRLILHNIFTNAVRACEKNSYPSRMDVLLYKEGNHLVIEFSDNGSGMPKEVMAAILTGHIISTKEKTDETNGLGLDCSREFAKRMNGLLYPKATSHDGTTMVLKLKLD